MSTKKTRARALRMRQDPSNHWLDHDVNVAAHQASTSLDLLFHQASGTEPIIPRWWAGTKGTKVGTISPEAIRFYASLICKHVKLLNSTLVANPLILQHLREVSRNSVAWPMLIGKRRAFSDDTDVLLRLLKVAELLPYANNPYARFNPDSKYCKVALNLLQRIEYYQDDLMFVLGRERAPHWATRAHFLSPLSSVKTRRDREKWLAVIDSILEEDFKDADRSTVYRAMVIAPSHQGRWRSRFRELVKDAFESIFGKSL